MTSEDQNPSETTVVPSKPAYDAPAIEDTITSEEIEREVHYAGVGSQNMQ